MHRQHDHANHDATLIAGHAAGDLVGAQLVLATRLLAACEDCARLHADLRAITAATRVLPARATAAPRDFRLTSDVAAGIRRGGLWRRLLRPLASPSSVTRPLATTLSTLGAAGLAIVLLLPALGGTAAAPAPERNTQNLGVAATAPPEGFVPGGAAAATMGTGSATSDDMSTEVPEDLYAGGNGAGAGPGVGSDGLTAPSSSWTIALLGSAGLLGIGLALFALRFAARRLT
jgi:hypothetical protein